jgi:hypothetical protein
LAIIMGRIRVKEKALPVTLGGYQVYAVCRKRIIPSSGSYLLAMRAPAISR